MSFDLYRPLQAPMALAGLKVTQYDLVNQASKRSGWIRLAAPLVAVTTSVLSLAIIVSAVVEPIIKSLAILFVSLFTNECTFIQGLKCITVCFGLGVLTAGVCTGIGIFETIITPFGIAIAPEKYSVWAAEKLV